MAMIAAPPITQAVDAGDRHYADILTVSRVWRGAEETRDDGGETVGKHGSDAGPGRGSGSRLRMFAVTTRWPTCSAITTSAAGRIVKMANHSKRGV